MTSAFYSLLKALDGRPVRGQQQHQQQDGWPLVYIHSLVYVKENTQEAAAAAEEAVAAAAAADDAAAAAAEAAERQRLLLQEHLHLDEPPRGQHVQEAGALEGFLSFFVDDGGEPQESLFAFLDEW